MLTLPIAVYGTHSLIQNELNFVFGAIIGIKQANLRAQGQIWPSYCPSSALCSCSDGHVPFPSHHYLITSQLLYVIFFHCKMMKCLS
ncbi:hypothetical protein JD844_032354 [Phrynosoma platyrhinos]|uniref:Uncharacterized protein n=1 Tax=Phrynosoma platyrhinos TaxID=52577 RepID=A0ABQ7T4T5_PHRPL|nr:hypothetical protein JD844_032354 [Phrynosoma platyrhinos]